MSAERFMEYVAHHELFPWGDDWEQAGTIAAAIYNANKSSGAPLVKPDRFIPRHEPIQVQSSEQIKAALIASVTRYNARKK